MVHQGTGLVAPQKEFNEKNTPSKQENAIKEVVASKHIYTMGRL